MDSEFRTGTGLYYRHQLINLEAKAIFILEPFCHTLAKIIDKTDVKTVVISTIDDMLGTVKGKVVNLAAKHIKKAVPSHGLKSNVNYKVISFKSVLKKGKSSSYSRPMV